MAKICVLTDLEIPKGRESREHMLPKSRVNRNIWTDPRNIFYAHSKVNEIKSNLLPCEFEELKFKLTYNALVNWNLTQSDRLFLRKALDHWEDIDVNPCKLCLLQCNQRSR